MREAADNDMERQARRRIALLLSFADLADRAALLPSALRFLLLWILRPAEAHVRDYVFSGDPDAIEMLAPLEGANGPGAAAAAALADSFRELALTLDYLARQQKCFANWRSCARDWNRPDDACAGAGHPWLDLIEARRLLFGDLRLDLEAFAGLAFADTS
jgi:hypothetical protein